MIVFAGGDNPSTSIPSRPSSGPDASDNVLCSELFDRPSSGRQLALVRFRNLEVARGGKAPGRLDHTNGARHGKLRLERRGPRPPRAAFSGPLIGQFGKPVVACARCPWPREASRLRRQPVSPGRPTWSSVPFVPKRSPRRGLRRDRYCAAFAPKRGRHAR